MANVPQTLSNSDGDEIRSAGLKIQIIGPQQFQNSLLCAILTRELGIPCSCGEKLDVDAPDGDRRVLILCDVQEDKIFDEVRRLSRPASDRADSQYMIALFNFNREMKIPQHEIFASGIKGIFIKNDPLDQVLKGIRAIFKGSHWFPRDLLNGWIFEAGHAMHPERENPVLTRREREILQIMATGASNEEISTELSISYHTVKTHLSKIYKKLHVSNRLSASLWASRNL